MALRNGPTPALFDLTGKTAFVTAAGQGLGRGVALRLADAGANVVELNRLGGVEEAIRKHGLLSETAFPHQLPTSSS